MIESMVCATCGTSVARSQATWDGGIGYCGTCAPAAPIVSRFTYGHLARWLSGAHYGGDAEYIDVFRSMVAAVRQDAELLNSSWAEIYRAVEVVTHCEHCGQMGTLRQCYVCERRATIESLDLRVIC